MRCARRAAARTSATLRRRELRLRFRHDAWNIDRLAGSRMHASFNNIRHRDRPDMNRHSPSRRIVAYTLFFAALAIPAPGYAQLGDYPSKPVRMIVDSAAGSANDATARILADKLGRIWNQQVLTVN